MTYEHCPSKGDRTAVESEASHDSAQRSWHGTVPARSATRKGSVRGMLVCSLIVACACLAAVSASGQTLDEYKAAVSAMESSKGCESIPNSAYQSECKRWSEEVEKLCKEDSWSCSKALLETRAIRERQVGLERHLASLSTGRDELRRQKAGVAGKSDEERVDEQIRQVEEQIATATKEQEFAKTSLATDLSDIERRIEAGNKCLTARTEVKKIFEKAAEDAKRETDQEKRALANRLLYYWNGRDNDHKKAFEDVERGIEYCNQCKRGDV